MGKSFKRFLKHLIRYNPLDYGIPHLRAFYRKLGILEYLDEQTYWVLWKITRILKLKAWPGESTGMSNVPKTDAAVFVCNHSHLFDPFFSASRVYRRVMWVSKIENYSTPFFRPILSTTSCIPVRRGESDMNMVRLVRKRLSEGEIVGMFPEGTRSKSGVLQKFHTGAARFCLEFGIPYIPTVVINSYKVKVGDKVDVHIGKPRYPPKDMPANYENCKWFTEVMRNDIVALLKKYDTEHTVIIPDLSTEVIPVKSSAAEIIAHHNMS